MKILLSLLNEFTGLNKYSIGEVSEYLTNSGLEVDSTYKVKDYDFLKDLIIGEIVDCIKHPNADKLKCVKVNIGNNNILNIVCGAPNARTGIKVIVARDNTYIITFSGEKIKIKKTKIRGEISEGMLCAEDEIGISDNHDKIIEISDKISVGTSVDKIYDFKNEYILNIELTHNRWYSSSHLCLAKDLLAKINFEEHCGYALKDIDYECIDFKKKLKKIDYISVEMLNKNICRRYCGLLFRNVKVQESPQFIKERLKFLDIKTINNVVDIANYVMFEIGQPLHSYDYNKIKNNIQIRESGKGEKIQALDNNEYILDEDIVICNNDKVLCLAGVIGSKDSSVTNDSVDIFFESASFASEKILKTSKRLNIYTEASLRFSHGINTEETQFYALQRVYELLTSQQGDIICEGYVDIRNDVVKNKIIKTSFYNINKIIGQKIDKDIIKKILNNLEIEINHINEDIFEAKIPLYRYNIQTEADIVDEILRIYGYEKIKYSDKEKIISYSSNSDEYERLLDIIKKISMFLCSNGFYEIKTNSLIEKKFAIENKENKPVIISNSASNKFEILRQNLIFSGLETVKHNIDNGNKNLKLFEFGKIYFENDKKENIEEKHLGIFITGKKNISWRGDNKEVDFFDVKDIVFNIFDIFNIKDIYYELNENDKDIFNNNVEIKVKGKAIANFGEVAAILLKQYDIKKTIFFADININELFKEIEKNKETIYHEISNLPIVKRDLSLVIDKNIKYEDIEKAIKDLHEENIIDIELFSTFDDKKYGADKKIYSISIFLQDKKKSLKNEKTQAIIDRIMETLKKKLYIYIKDK